ncbi:MAG: tRNA (guanosine(37)-N1)-methyltransferase TrmD [Candidatus Omnitrophota bacterium]|nr:tRNA (guanosine(37)-N1)-methyltransferase TrmD [Candidatus Omnitrophota bacterium]
MGMKIDILTLFPDFFSGPLGASLLHKAQQKRKVEIRVHDLRGYTHDKHKTADDKPFGGGAGMVMKPEPIFECVEDIGGSPWVILLDACGQPVTQERTRKLACKEHLLFIAGHYEGVDYRVREHLVDQEISVGDFVTMGGEAPALCMIEAVVRLIPGVLGNAESLTHESFESGYLEYPQYTRPRSYRGWKVPEVLVSGNHGQVQNWRNHMMEEMTRTRRPDLLLKLDDFGTHASRGPQTLRKRRGK